MATTGSKSVKGVMASVLTTVFPVSRSWDRAWFMSSKPSANGWLLTVRVNNRSTLRDVLLTSS